MQVANVGPPQYKTATMAALTAHLHSPVVLIGRMVRGQDVHLVEMSSTFFAVKRDLLKPNPSATIERTVGPLQHLIHGATPYQPRLGPQPYA